MYNLFFFFGLLVKYYPASEQEIQLALFKTKPAVMIDAQMKAVISQSTAEQKGAMTFGMVERPRCGELMTTKCHGFKQHSLLNLIDFV